MATAAGFSATTKTGADAPEVTRMELMSKQLRSGTYECVVCTEGIRTTVATTACGRCHRVYHLFCMKKWSQQQRQASREAAAAAAGSNATPALRDNETTCPSCRATIPAPTSYKCFCGRATDPKPDGFLVPHSCGEACGRSRGHACPHRCTAPCHPGPCPPCSFQAPPVKCPCGARTYTYPCGRPDPRTTCGAVCGKMLGCGNHRCERPCHHGPCGPCAVTQRVECHCGHESRELACGQGAFSCNHPCERLQRCGTHKCTMVCHPRDRACPPCDTDPSVVATCHCGKAPLAQPRLKCTDDIPSCGAVCERVLVCGLHQCTEVCHEGRCPPCTVKRAVHCPCGSLQQKVRCCDADKVQCYKTCGAQLLCGRHTCKSTCCPARRGGEAVKTLHQCRQACGRALICGHRCLEPCHTGACPPCPNIIEEDLMCGCGAEFLPAPQPCGTKLPQCRLPCARPLPCGHEPVPHPCHSGECPPCRAPAERQCIGGHTDVKVYCFTAPELIVCGRPCAHPLSCGHACERKCHAGPCAPPDKKYCGQRCGCLLDCGHACAAKCHGRPAQVAEKEAAANVRAALTAADAGADDDDDAAAEAGAAADDEAVEAAVAAASAAAAEGLKPCPPCSAKTPVTCKCGAQQVPLTCRALQALRAEAPAGTPIEQLRCACLDDCDMQRRLQALRPAASDAAVTSGRGGFLYSVRVWLAIKDPAKVDFMRGLEPRLREALTTAIGVKMPPMQRERRGLVHELAWHWGLKTESFDPEPRRHVFIEKAVASAPPSALIADVLKSESHHNPIRLLQLTLPSIDQCRQRVIVFEGRLVTELALHVLLRPFVGKFVIAADAFQLEHVTHLADDAAERLERGDDVKVALAVFRTASDASAAVQHLRKAGTSSVVYHMFGEAPPPRMVADANGLLQMRSTPAVAFVKEGDDLVSAKRATGGAAKAAASAPSGLWARGAPKAHADPAAAGGADTAEALFAQMDARRQARKAKEAKAAEDIANKFAAFRR